MFQQTFGKAFFFGRGRIAQNTGAETDRGVDHCLSRDFTAREDEVAKRDFFDLVMIQHALIDALEPAADQSDAIGRRPFLRGSLGERFAARAEIDQRPAPSNPQKLMI